MRAAEPEDCASGMLHIASAVVTARPDDCADLARRIAALPAVEVRHREGSRIIVVIEANDSNTIAGRLAQIASMPGTVSANLVFEHAERLRDAGEQS